MKPNITLQVWYKQPSSSQHDSQVSDKLSEQQDQPLQDSDASKFSQHLRILAQQPSPAIEQRTRHAMHVSRTYLQQHILDGVDAGSGSRTLIDALFNIGVHAGVSAGRGPTQFEPGILIVLVPVLPGSIPLHATYMYMYYVWR